MLETKTCIVCSGEVNPEIESVVEMLPGEKVTIRFCSQRHRERYLDRTRSAG